MELINWGNKGMKIDNVIDSYKGDIIKDLRDLVGIKTVYEDSEIYPFGQANHDALEYMLDKCKREGMVTQNLDEYGGYADFGEGNKTIGVFTHLDVVPAGNGWNSDPFELKVEDGKLVGRGVSDDKGPVIAAFYAIKAIKESGIKLDSKIRFFFGLDEEKNLRCIERYNMTEKPPDVTLVPDADFPVTNYEKGLINFDITKEIKNSGSVAIEKFEGGELRGMVPDSCYLRLRADGAVLKDIQNRVKEFNANNEDKISITLRGNVMEIRTRGISAHASVPETGDNAISNMMQFLKTVNLGEDFNKFVQLYSKHFDTETDGKSLHIKTHDKTGDLTLNTGVVQYKDGKINLQATIRHPESISSDKIIHNLKETAENYHCKVQNIKLIPEMNIPHNSNYVKALLEVYTDFTRKEAKPVSIGFRTYASKLPNALGFGPNFQGEEKVAHKSNEYITIDNLMKNVKLMARAICKLDKEISGKYKEKPTQIVTNLSILNELLKKSKSSVSIRL